MPKSQIINPSEVFESATLKINSIPLNQYKADFKKEQKKYGNDGLKKIYYDMLLIREFESMLNSIKREGSYQGIQYNHAGPAHLSIGQEAASVGQCYHLGIDDLIFGSHRSHGEILAKCLSAINKLEDSALMETMQGYLGGESYQVVDKHNPGHSAKDLAENFILYGTLSEIFARANGINKGLGGSMHAFFIPFGSMPNNAIVGGSGDISVGAAMFKRINRKPGIVIGNIGDSSMGCGPVWEGMMMAAMDQYTTLWDKEIGGAPPILINFFNNFYGMGGQPLGETMGFKILARVGAGVNPDNMHAERVNGYNPLAVADAIERKQQILLAGKGPVLLDTVTYRMSGHSPSDASSYRTKEEMDLWEAADCVNAYAKYLNDNNVLSEDDMAQMKEAVVAKITTTLRIAASTEISPYGKPDFIETVMLSNTKMEKMEDREVDVLMTQEDNPRVQALKNKVRYGIDSNGKPVAKNKVFALRDGIFEAMLHRFYIDPTMVAYGEENRDWGGAFAAYRGLTEAIPYHRLFNSPISEGAIVGTGVGYAISGGRAVVELMYCDFMGRAGDELFNQVSKWQSMSAGILKMPLVVRVSVGSKYGAQHSQDWTALVAHIPGLKVMFPVTPYDAKGMLNLALAGTDPVIFFESQRLYDMGELFVESGVPEGYYEVEEGEPAIRRQGTDMTIITVGSTLYKALEAADELQSKHGISAEVIDLRFISPLNYDKIIASVRKTGKVVLASDACERGSFLNDVAANLTQMTFDYLDGPPVIVGSRNWITPAPEQEPYFFPQKDWILDAIHENILPLKDHTVTTNRTMGERIRRSRLGV